MILQEIHVAVTLILTPLSRAGFLAAPWLVMRYLGDLFWPTFRPSVGCPRYQYQVCRICSVKCASKIVGNEVSLLSDRNVHLGWSTAIAEFPEGHPVLSVFSAILEFQTGCLSSSHSGTEWTIPVPDPQSSNSLLLVCFSGPCIVRVGNENTDWMLANGPSNKQLLAMWTPGRSSTVLHGSLQGQYGGCWRRAKDSPNPQLESRRPSNQ